MAGKLTAKQVEHAGPGRHGDGDGLSLLVKPNGGRSWVLRYSENGRRRDKGLGGWPRVGLAEARGLALRFRADGAMPEADDAEEPPMIFEDVARRVLDALRPTWRQGDKRRPIDWWRRLEVHAAPIMGKRVTEIRRRDVLDIIEPLAVQHPVAARRLRQQIRKVIGYAMARDERILTNPAGEALDGALMAAPRPCSHRRALHHDELPEAMALVERSGSDDATLLAFRFLALTAVRSVECREAVWSEIDFAARVWAIPGKRMKSGRPHRVPLSRQALDVLDAAVTLPNRGETDLIFPSRNLVGRSLSGQAFRELLDANGVDSTPHGLRASFRQWAMEQPTTSWAACELALAHSLGGQAVSAYTRDADLLEERRQLMQLWADFVART